MSDHVTQIQFKETTDLLRSTFETKTDSLQSAFEKKTDLIHSAFEKKTDSLQQSINNINKRFDDLIELLQHQFGLIDQSFKENRDLINCNHKEISKNREEITKNGDVLTQVIQRFDSESAANQLRFMRIEDKLSI